MHRGLTLGLAAVLVSGCATDAETSPPPGNDIPLAFEPIGRLVSTDYDYGFHVDGFETEEGVQYVYNDEIRSPDSPVGPLPVDCDETKQIGVWLSPGPEKKKKRTLDRHVDIYAKQPRVDVQWSHSERPEGDTRYHWKRRVAFGYRFITRLNLTRDDRTDGVMTLKIHKGDEVLYTTSFQLMGCGLRTGKEKAR